MRNIGLDISRSTAIILVLLAHSKLYFPLTFYNLLETLGIFGVEIFFTLSGFLIGQIIINDVLEEGSWSSLKRFYIRRWLRTLPIYYVVLFFLFIFNKTFHWEHILFLQNFKESTLLFFPESWSLSVEEWFYLLIPFVLLLITKIFGNKKVRFISICIILILLLLAIRGIYVYVFNPKWVIGVRMQPFLRMDSLVFGVLFAGIKIYYKKTYKLIVRRAVLLLSLSVLGLTLCGFYFFVNFNKGIFDHTFFPRTLYLSIIPLFSIGVVIALENMKFGHLNNKLIKVINFISLTSYSTYLIHYGIIKNLYKLKKIIPYYPFTMLIWIISLCLIYTIAWFSYKYVEQPVLRYRDKITLTYHNQVNIKV